VKREAALESLATARATPLIELDRVGKRYGTGELAVHALQDVSLAIYPGEFVAIMGASGSGKSTLMNLLGCLDRPTSGAYRFRGEDVSTLGRDGLARLRRESFGFIFQSYNLIGTATALENVEVPALYAGVPAGERRARGAAILDSLGLAARLDHRPSELSGGQQQRVAIARAIVTDPVVLLADEPTGNLDTKTSREIMDLVTSLNRDQGITVIMVTHENDIAAYADRIVRFLDGRVESDAPRQEAA
jgi:ABC-type lipoprotein export system ATPase subunit